MKIVTADFIRSCLEKEQFPRPDRSEVACVGRSNAGKSSLINSLLYRKRLAKVSGTPGKTRVLNFFQIRTADPRLGSLHLVDLPGYGYARVSRSVRTQWGPLVEGYLTERPCLRIILFLVDARGLERSDWTTFEWLSQTGRPLLVVATKVDKLGRGERPSRLAAISDSLGLPGSRPLIPYSSLTHEGRDELWRAIRERLLGGRG
jgi:GTP-binding protein